MDRETKILAVVTFILSFFTYLSTIAPTVPFWDCGEFTACAYIMGIPHPPGAPLFMLLGRVFSFIPWGDVAFRVNLISVFASAFTVMLLFLIIVRLMQEWRGKEETQVGKIIVNAAGFIGAMSFAFTDTFWFNAVESEVYAMSLLLTALVFWLALVWMDNAKDYKSVRFLLFIVYLFGLGAGIHLLNLLVVPSILLFIIFTDRKLLLRFDLWAWIPILIILGYSTYIMIYIRSGLHPVINENDPSTWEGFKAYLRREQYGTHKIFPRVAPVWAYQIKKMFLRYFSWQFIGKGTIIGADSYLAENLSFRGLYGLPFLAGLLGVVHHFYKDWKRALSVFFMFIIMGIALVIYLNQPDPQPRERDYVYIGCFFAFAIWIGIGAVGIFETIYYHFRERTKVMWAFLIGAFVVITVLVPGNMLKFNYHSHDRTGNYVPYDYSYNILQSCEPNAILFTNGDNDTFPLWYLQEVEGIRKDVSVANLSLLNTKWYIKQLKHREPKVPISFTDEQIDNIMPIPWKPQTYKLKIPASIYKPYMEDVKDEMELTDEPVTMEFTVNPTYGGRALLVKDYAVLNIIHANRWRKPIYFALTVSDDNKVGLSEYLRMDGMALKLIPFKKKDNEASQVSKKIMGENLFEKFKYRGIDDPNVYFNQQTKDLLQNYRTMFSMLAHKYYQENNKDKTLQVLDKMEEIIPRSVIPAKNAPLDLQIGRIYSQYGRYEELEVRLDDYSQTSNDPNQLRNYGFMYSQINKNQKAVKSLEKAIEIKKDFSQAYSLLLFLYDKEKMHTEEIELLKKWLEVNPNDNSARAKMEELIKMQQDSANTDTAKIK